MLVIRNIGQLVIPSDATRPVDNRVDIQTLESAYVSMDAERIVAVGADAEFIRREGCEVIDARGGCVVPGLIDCHTHTVFAGSREAEFVMRIRGRNYAEIAESGGGIINTVRAVRASTVDELVQLAMPRLRRMLANGVTTVEIKSGYGLSVADEIKMLRVVKQLGELQPIELVGTFLGAHTIPPEFTHQRSKYIDLVTSDEMMGLIVEERLAEFCDVFCERSALSVEESRRVLQAGRERGLMPKLHADQITQIGASRLAAEVRAISADHLETIDEGGIDAMKSAGVIAVLLPACSFFLGVEQAPARRMMKSGLPVALGTDYNPGSSMVESLPLAMSIACTQMHMTPAEVLVATTINAAAAINRAATIGAIGKGRQADLAILDVPNYEQWPYNAGRNCVRTVVKRGRVVYGRDEESAK